MAEDQEKQRTGQQRKALEVYCNNMAQLLNLAGFDQKATIEAFARVDMPNTQESVKDIFRGCSAAMYPDTMGNEPSTAKLSSTQIQDAYEAVNRAFGQRMGVTFEWPSDDPPMITDRDILK